MANAAQLVLSPLGAIAAPTIDIAVVNNFPTTSAAPGVAVPYEIFLRNTTGTAATITQFNHTLPVPLPGYLVFDATTPTENTCNLPLTITPGVPNVSPGSISVTGGTIPGGALGECKLSIPVKGFTGGPHVARILSGELITDQGENDEPTSASFTVAESSPATLAMGFNPTTIPGAGRSTVTITITNPNTFELTGTTDIPTLTNTLPNSPNPLTVDTGGGAPAPTTTCVGGTINILSGSSGIELVGGTIPAQGSCTITFPVTQTNGGIYTNTIAENSLNTTGLITNNNAVSRDLSVQTQAVINKSMAATELIEGESTLLTIDISNGGGQLTNVELTDNLPLPLVVADVPNASTTCTNNGVTRELSVTPGSNTLTLSNANVVGASARVPASNPNQNLLGTCSISLTVTADPDVIGNVTDTGILITNTIPVGSLVSQQGRTNENEASDTLSIFPALVVTKAYSNDNTIAPGSTTRLTVTLSNNSSVEDATGVGFTDTFPSPDLTIASVPDVSSSGCGTPIITATPGDNFFSVSGGTITTNSTCSISVDVIAATTAPVGANYDNVIPHDDIANDQGFDSDGVTDSEGQLSVIRRIELIKTFDANVVRRGLASTLILEIRNNRRLDAGVPQPLTAVEITDGLPTNLKVATPANFSHTGCNFSSSPVFTGTTPNSTTLTMTNGSIAPVTDGNANADTCRIEIDVIEDDLSFANFPTPITYTNTTSGFTNFEGESIGATATDDLRILSSLDGSKVFQSPKITANGRSTAVVRLDNSFPFALTGVAFDDTWTQNNVVIANPPNTSTTCGGTVAATPGTRTATLTGGTVPAQAGGVIGICEVRFDVVMDATGPDLFENILDPNDVSAAEGFTNGEPISAILERVVADISIVKEFSLLSLVTGDPSTLTVTISNPPSGIDMTEFGFIDTMPADMKVFTIPNPTTTCNNGTVTAAVGSNEFELSGADLPAGQSCQVSVRIAPTTRGNLTNVIPQERVTSKENVTNPLPTEATITGNPALKPTKTFDREEIAGGVPSQMTLTIENLQTNTETGEDLTNVSLTDNLPSDLLVANPANASTDCPNGTVVANPGDNTVTLTGATLSPLASCEILVDVTSTIAGTYLNQIARGDVTASIQTSLGGTTIQNFDTAEDTLIVTDDIGLSELLLVKRITAVNGATENPNDTTDLNGFIDEASSTDDDAPNWPLNYIRGAVDGGGVVEDDVVEYTIYFRNAGERDAASVRICDRIQPYQSLLLGSFSGGADMELQIGSNPPIPLTAAGDTADRAQLLPPGAPVPSSCNITEANTNGVVVLDVTGNTGAPSLPLLPRLGQNPDNSYGSLRIRTRIQPE